MDGMFRIESARYEDGDLVVGYVLSMPEGSRRIQRRYHCPPQAEGRRMTCDAKIRPLLDDTELVCEFDGPESHTHRATLKDYAYPGSRTKITWMESDRRTFRGEWEECEDPRCVLPNHHRGNHAP